MIRRGAADMLASPNPENGTVIARLLNDRVRSVRIEAAASLAGAAARDQRANVVDAFARASAEYVEAQQLDADRPEAHLNLGIFYANSGKVERAEAELRAALSIDPSFSPAAVNLADLLSRSGHLDDAQGVLLEAMRHAADDASLPYALGLLRVRQGKIAEALDLFRSAVRLAPSNPEYSYVYAVASHDAGNSIAAIETLERSVRRNPYHRESLAMLASLYNRTGQHEKALKCERILHEFAQNGGSWSENVNPE